MQENKTVERYNTYSKICERAEKLGIGQGTRFTKMMDVELADKHYGMRLQDWLNADDFNFAHDFIGIQNHINRITKTFDNTFLPRFAGASV